ncbi:hypothetical protein [Granulicella rosea]|nr:hypothetical protein [Granulicella rosea]
MKMSIALVALSVGRLLQAQTSDLPTAPKPAQLASAKTVFISNNTIGSAEGSEFLYTHLYNAIQKLHRFDIVLTPQDADLILEYSISDVVGQNNPGHVHALRILDPRTRIVLWSINEYEPGANRQSSIEKNLLDAHNHLAADLQKVTSPTK